MSVHTRCRTATQRNSAHSVWTLTAYSVYFITAAGTIFPVNVICSESNTQGEVTSQYVWSRYDVGQQKYTID